MTCIVMGKYYIKTGVNVKNGIFQLPSASRRAAFETSTVYPADGGTILYSANVRGSFKLSTGQGTVLPPGAVMSQVTIYLQFCSTFFYNNWRGITLLSLPRKIFGKNRPPISVLAASLWMGTA